MDIKSLWPWWEMNPQHSGYISVAVPTELKSEMREGDGIIEITTMGIKDVAANAYNKKLPISLQGTGNNYY